MNTRTFPAPCETCHGSRRVVTLNPHAPADLRLVSGLGFHHDRCPDCGGHGEAGEPEALLLEPEALELFGTSLEDARSQAGSAAQMVAGEICRSRYGVR